MPRSVTPPAPAATADTAVSGQAGREARHRALIAALEDMEGWLAKCVFLP